MFDILEVYVEDELYGEYKNNPENFMTYICWANSLEELYDKETTEMNPWSYNWVCITLEKHTTYPIYKHTYIKRKKD